MSEIKITIRFSPKVTQEFTSGKAARAFLRSRGLTVKDFDKADNGLWTPTKEAASAIAKIDVSKRIVGAVDPEVAAAREKARAEKAAAKAAASAAKAKERADAKAARDAAKAAKVAEKEAARKAKADEKAAKEQAAQALKDQKAKFAALTIEQIMPKFGMAVASAEKANDGKAVNQADVYGILLDGARWPTEMSTTDREKTAKRLARQYVTK